MSMHLEAGGGPLEATFRRALDELDGCVRPGPGGEPVLQEGGNYPGAWLESTGSIGAEVLGRFRPEAARATFLLFADHARADGLLPYKVTAAGPAYRQVQMVTPLARSVWNLHRSVGGDRDLLARMYPAMEANDAWLARHRDTRGTGAVEAFCTFDTGHDLSPRLWHVPDTTPGGDPARYDPGSPLLPLIAPDLTANVVCQRRHLALIAEVLGHDPRPWRARADAAEAALFAQCYDRRDGTFYDRDPRGGFVRVQSDVLLRVLACDVGDGPFFAAALAAYLLNTRKFFARYPFTSLALDDPRFDQNAGRNSWGGPTNFLSLLRAPHAFDRHGRHVELSWALRPVLAALCRTDRFPQTLDPWSGDPGFTDRYSPAILWFLDAVERLGGILARPDGEVWCTALLPEAVRCTRRVGSVDLGLDHVDGTAVMTRDGVERARFPFGWRLVTDRDGQVSAVIGMSARPVEGVLVTGGRSVRLTLEGNERAELGPGGEVVRRGGPGVVFPQH